MKHNKFDCHVHTHFSPDSKILPEDVCKKAIDIGLSGIIFTDHFELGLETVLPKSKKNWIFDHIARAKCLEDLKQKYKNQIKILNGIEVGIQPDIAIELSQFIHGANFDFVIGSTHIVDKLDLATGKYFENKTQKQAYQRYLEVIYSNICNFTDYDIVGHIGYARRYGNFDNKDMKYQDYDDIIDMILKKVIADGKGIEINTSGYRKGLKTSIPTFDIIKRYHELGGEILTIGSDAHKLQEIGYDFDNNIKKIKEIGFKHLTYFEKRKPVFVKI